MFSTINTKEIRPQIFVQASYFDMNHMLQPVPYLPSYNFSQQSLNSFRLAQQSNEDFKHFFCQNQFKDSLANPEAWSHTQIEKLFKLYDYYGPQWKIMSQQMPTRTANNLKNRFYTVLRNLIKLLFRKNGNACPKLTGEIPSKDISRLYDGKQDYEQFKNLISTILQEIDYNLYSEKMDDVVKSHSNEIIKVYQTVFRSRIQLNSQISQNQMETFKIRQVEKSQMPLLSFGFQKTQQGIKQNQVQSLSEEKRSQNLQQDQSGKLSYVYLLYFTPSECHMTLQI